MEIKKIEQKFHPKDRGHPVLGLQLPGYIRPQKIRFGLICPKIIVKLSKSIPAYQKLNKKNSDKNVCQC